MNLNKFYWIVKLIIITFAALVVLIVAVNYLAQGYIKEAVIAAVADFIIFGIGWYAYLPLIKKKE